MNDEFDGTRFVAGSIIGLRSFKIDRLGRLTGVSHNVVFRPGENVAECRKSESSASMWSPFLQSLYNDMARMTFTYSPGGAITGGGTATPKKDPAPKPVSLKKKPKHRVAGLNCGCGFWAYFDGGDNPHHSGWNQLLGIVEGYGTVTTGTRGFRAEKANLLALVIKPKRENALTDRVRVNYPEVAIFPSKRDALAEFPLSTHMIPTPDSDSEFWTRSAS